MQVFGMSFRFGCFAGRVLGSSKIDSEDRFVFWLFDLGKGGDDFKTLTSLYLLLRNIEMLDPVFATFGSP